MKVSPPVKSDVAVGPSSRSFDTASDHGTSLLRLSYCPILQAARPARDLSSLQQRLSAAEADVEGLRAALEAAQERHSQQLNK